MCIRPICMWDCVSVYVWMYISICPSSLTSLCVCVFHRLKKKNLSGFFASLHLFQFLEMAASHEKELGGKDGSKGNPISPGHLHTYSVLLVSWADPTQAYCFIIQELWPLVGEGELVSLAALSPGSRCLRKALWHPGALQPEHLCLNPPCGPRLACDWAPAQLPFGTAVPCWPWNPAPNHSCLAWGLTIHLLLAKVLPLWRTGTYRILLSPALRGLASTLMAQTFLSHQATCLPWMFLGPETLKLPCLHCFDQIPWKIRPTFAKPLGSQM